MITLNDATIEKRFEELSKIAGRDTTSLIKEAITTHRNLDDLENLYICVERKKNPDFVSLEEARKELGLDN